MKIVCITLIYVPTLKTGMFGDFKANGTSNRNFPLIKTISPFYSSTLDFEHAKFLSVAMACALKPIPTNLAATVYELSNVQEL